MLVYQQDTVPTALPLTLPEVKEHLKVPYTSEDVLIGTLMGAATEYAEAHTRRALMPRNFLHYMNHFPGPTWYSLPRAKLRSVISITYYDRNDALQTLASSKYYVDIDSEPGGIKLKKNEIWPLTETDRPNAIITSFTAGYADQDDIPDSITTAMYLMIAHWFENRETVVVGPTGLRIKEVPLSATLLLDQHRVMTFF